ncbi:hypothetical protein GCM10010497_00360 [Streptomyces cinereoruber]|uniref:Uncharacterized protein n=1 Tax=Streptomyces cinereoruber TaxID=67260 RepID=A0AAV4K9K8_9ACTN|nr:hypothetical protein GCM10010497_00360 [Streptomyces cinereoruber]
MLEVRRGGTAADGMSERRRGAVREGDMRVLCTGAFFGSVAVVRVPPSRPPRPGRAGAAEGNGAPEGRGWGPVPEAGVRSELPEGSAALGRAPAWRGPAAPGRPRARSGLRAASAGRSGAYRHAAEHTRFRST